MLKVGSDYAIYMPSEFTKKVFGMEGACVEVHVLELGPYPWVKVGPSPGPVSPQMERGPIWLNFNSVSAFREWEPANLKTKP